MFRALLVPAFELKILSIHESLGFAEISTYLLCYNLASA